MIPIRNYHKHLSALNLGDEFDAGMAVSADAKIFLPPDRSGIVSPIANDFF